MLTVAIAGCVVLLACWSMLIWVSGRIRSEFHREIDALSAAVRALEQNATEGLVATAPASPTYRHGAGIAAARPMQTLAVQAPAIQEFTEIPAETQVAVKEALFTSLGHRVRVRSMRLVENPDGPTNWATQGRVAVQTSHNQRTSSN